MFEDAQRFIKMRFDSLVKLALWVKNRWWMKTLAIPLVIALPPSILGASDHVEWAKKLFVSYPGIKTPCCLWPLILIPASAAYQKLCQYEPVVSDHVMHFLKIIDHIVGKKFERFGNKLRSIGAKSGFDAKDAFFSITQPDDQILELVEGIWKYFELTKTDPAVNIRVALARMGDEHIDAFDCFYPADQGPRSDVSTLQNHESGFSSSKKMRKMLIVADIFKEGRKAKGRKFVVTREDLADDEGSMICYPIEERHTNAVPYVVSICATKSSYFKLSEKGRYEVILRRFAQRIVLEYCLKCIKDKTA